MTIKFLKLKFYETLTFFDYIFKRCIKEAQLTQ